MTDCLVKRVLARCKAYSYRTVYESITRMQVGQQVLYWLGCETQQRPLLVRNICSLACKQVDHTLVLWKMVGPRQVSRLNS